MPETVITSLIVGGLERTTGLIEDVIDPATGEVAGRYHVATPDVVGDALTRADHAVAVWRDIRPWARSKILHAVADDVRKNSEETARTVTREVGKPLAEARAEVKVSADAFDWVAEEVLRLHGQSYASYSDTALAEVVQRPIGIVLALTPWNFPFNLPTRKLAMALGAGCPVILRPAEQSPESAASLVRSCLAGGVPADAIALIMGAPDVTVAPLMADPRVRAVSFTGSTAVGKYLVRQSAATVKRLVLELGGHAPFIVMKGTDIETAANSAVMAKFRNAGQVCTSPTRFFVDKSCRDDFVDAFITGARKLVLGNGFEAGVTMGPLSVQRHWSRTDSLVADAVRHGARLAHGGGRPPALNRGYFFEPTVLTEVAPTSPAMTEEPFAPVALINAFDTVGEALELANRHEAGLAGYVFGPPGDELERVVGALEVGIIGVNTTALSAVDVPFGGIKQSGYGKEGGSAGLAEFLTTVARHRAIRP